MRRLNRASWVLLPLLFIAFSALTYSQSETTENHTSWIAQSLKNMESVKVGMTRKELLEVFREEGGISTRTWRRYAYRECPYIKVDVEFKPVEKNEARGTEYSSDEIVKISKPFLEPPIVD
ncbi:MAG TPA: hypothetical protein VNS63_14495 [Blastocatellia bacterium]|nr:hypothetical protein [Blastocatellia bacterium]